MRFRSVIHILRSDAGELRRWWVVVGGVLGGQMPIQELLLCAWDGDCKELVNIQSWLRNNQDNQMAQLSGFDQLKIISLNFSSSKYSVFDSLRQSGPLQESDSSLGHKSFCAWAIYHANQSEQSIWKSGPMRAKYLKSGPMRAKYLKSGPMRVLHSGLRRREEKGDYLGWSKDILGESERERE